MQILILGSAAGGGFPQWNCACSNCRRLRAGTFPGQARTQTQIAVSQDGRLWFLLNASPDLRLQIEATAALHPRDGTRSSPIAGVVLTSADIDQVAGLLSLRELQRFRVYCTPSVGRIVRDHNSMFTMLNRISVQAEWTHIPSQGSFPLTTVESQDSGLCCEAFSLTNRYPAYVGNRAAELAGEQASLGLLISGSSGGRLAYLPAVGKIDDVLLARLDNADLVLFDGTFWSDDELIRVQGSGATAREMGHIPVGSASGTLSQLAGLKRPRRVFVHINNTNPMLDEASPEHAQVRAAGWEIAEDGWQFEL